MHHHALSLCACWRANINVYLKSTFDPESLDSLLVLSKYLVPTECNTEKLTSHLACKVFPNMFLGTVVFFYEC